MANCRGCLHQTKSFDQFPCDACFASPGYEFGARAHFQSGASCGPLVAAAAAPLVPPPVNTLAAPLLAEPGRVMTQQGSPQTKDTNPKDAVGIKKVPFSALPMRVLWRVGLAMLEGALKYGRHNFRGAGVRASVYFDAVVARHLTAWWEGEDIDADSGLSHIDKAIAALMVMRDSMLEGNFTDDRPPRIQNDMAELNAHAARLLERYGHINPHHHTLNDKGATA